MDDKRFDRIAQALAADGSRRRALGVLAGGVAALAGAATLEAKRGGNGKGRGRGRGRGDGGPGNGGTGNNNGNGGNGRGRGRAKVYICHQDDEGEYHLIRVGAPAVPAHQRHDDVVCDDLDCQVVTGCGVDEETGDPVCTYEPDASAEGDACVAEGGEAGTCDAAGACVGEGTGDEG